MNWKTWALAIGLPLPLVVLLAVGFGKDPHAVPSVLEGTPAPVFALPDVDGKPQNSKDFEGKPTVLNFWATWCEPCKLEHALLQEAAKYYADRVNFVGIVHQDELSATKAYLEARGQSYPQLFDPEGQVGVDFGITGVPESFFLDARGNIAKKHIGVLNQPSLQDALEPLLTRN